MLRASIGKFVRTRSVADDKVDKKTEQKAEMMLECIIAEKALEKVKSDSGKREINISSKIGSTI